MGEATYYLKARYETKEQCEAGVSAFAALIEQGKEAEDYWQSNRDKTPEEFWPEFIEKFPAVAYYLRVDVLGVESLEGQDMNNGLAGKLDFGAGGDDEPGTDGETLLTFYATVWHFAEWDGLAAWLRRKTDAKVVGWLSDEYLDPFDCLDV